MSLLRPKTPHAFGDGPGVHLRLPRFFDRGPRWRLPRLTFSLVAALCAGSLALAACASLLMPAATRDASRLLMHQPALDTGGPGLRGQALVNEIERVRALTPYPPMVRDRVPVERLEGVSTGSVQMVVEQRAQCWWQRAWVLATEAGDVRAAAAANAVLHNAIDWPSNRTGLGAGRIIAINDAHEAQTGQLAAFKRRMANDCQAVFTTR